MNDWSKTFLRAIKVGVWRVKQQQLCAAAAVACHAPYVSDGVVESDRAIDVKYYAAAVRVPQIEPRLHSTAVVERVKELVPTLAQSARRHELVQHRAGRLRGGRSVVARGLARKVGRRQLADHGHEHVGHSLPVDAQTDLGGLAERLEDHVPVGAAQRAVGVPHD